MSHDIERRLQYLEDRAALQDLIIHYCRSIDEIENVDDVVNCFTDDAVFDLTGLDLPVSTGRAEIKAFFQSVFDSMAYEAHYSTNFSIDRLEGDYADCSAYVIGHGYAHNGTKALVHARHVFYCKRTDGGWKIIRFEEPLLLPLPEKVEKLYE
jgi:ketosteroid isomerase-like protein